MTKNVKNINVINIYLKNNNVKSYSYIENIEIKDNVLFIKTFTQTVCIPLANIEHYDYH